MFTSVAEAQRQLVHRNKLAEMRGVLESAGLGDGPQAQQARRQIADIDQRVRDLQDQALEQRRLLVREMLLAFACGDIATVGADNLEACFKRHTLGQDQQGGVDLATIFKNQAKEWNRCVQMVDGDGDTPGFVSEYYADMADEITDTVVPIIYDIIDKWMNTPKGLRTF